MGLAGDVDGVLVQNRRAENEGNGLGRMRFFFGVEEEDISKEEFTYFLRKKMGKHLLACLHVSASRLLVTRERGMY